MGRHTKLTASQHGEIRAAVQERWFLRKRIKTRRQELEHLKKSFEKELAQDFERVQSLSNHHLAHRYGVADATIKRVLSDVPYAYIKPETTS